MSGKRENGSHPLRCQHFPLCFDERFFNQRDILTSNNYFMFPEVMMHEIKKYQSLVLEKSGLGLEDYQKTLQILLQKIALVPEDSYLSFYKKAESIMKDIDEKDIEYLACALGIKPDFIWSNDQHFKKQDRFVVLNNKEMVELTLNSN